jgi:hypothetical protein
MNKLVLLFLLFCSFLTSNILAQGFAFGPKGGLTLANQNYGGYDRETLLTYHGALYIENLSEEDKYALYAQLGFHQRGSKLLINRHFNPYTGLEVPRKSYASRFGNLSLQIGGKQKFDFGIDTKWYYSLGLRLEYNLTSELPYLYETWDDRIKSFVYGASVGIGMERMLSEHVGIFVEGTVSPDLSEQILIPAQPSLYNPNQVIPEKSIRNFSIEITLGLRLLRKIIYID